jgi:ribosome-associated heat shock protein Hsp15
MKVEKASHTVRVGDVLTVTLNRRVRLLKVTELGERRGPSAAALSLYEESTAPVDAPKPHAQSTFPIPSLQHDAMGPGRRAVGSGRPTKKERRDIDRLSAKNR